MKRFRRWVLMLMLVGLVTVPTVHAQRTTEVQLDTSFHPIPYELEKATISALQSYPTVQQDVYTIVSTRIERDWAFLSLAILQDGQVSENFDNSELVIAHKLDNNLWQVGIRGTSSFVTLIQSAPLSFVSSDAKRLMTTVQRHTGTNGTVTYKFPWPAGTVWQWWTNWHQSALDVGTFGSERRVLVSSSGVSVVTDVCVGTYSNTIKVRDADGVVMSYLHTDKNTRPANIYIGATVHQGQLLGIIKPGIWADVCGNADQTTTSAHLHWSMPMDRPMTIDGWTIQYPNNYWTNGSQQKVCTVINSYGSCASPQPNLYSTNDPNAVDSVPPDITFVANPAINTWYNTSQHIGWEITDNSSGVQGMSQAWDTTPSGPPPQFPGAAAGGLNFNGLTEGKHTVKVRAWDNAGNEKSAELGWFGYDISAPTGKLTAPTATNNPTIQLTANAYDGLSGVKQVEFYVSYDNLHPPVLQIDSDAPYEYTWTVPNGVADQDIKFTIHVIDNAGNKTIDAGGLITVSLDRTAPTGSVRLNNNWGVADGIAMPINLSANGTGSEVKLVRVSKDGVNWGAWQPMNSTIWAVLSGNHNGTATAYVQYQDAAGNVSNTITGNIALNFYPSKPQSSNYRIVKDVQAVDGGVMQSGNYQLNGTLGQAFANNGTAASPNYRATFGYWSKVIQTIINEMKVFVPLIVK